MTNIALIGHGRMGMEIERLAPAQNVAIKKIFDDQHTVSVAELSGVDVCIDFSTASAVIGNVTAAAEAGKNIVVGTTGWDQQLEEVLAIVRARHTGILISSNFSIGVNIFFHLVRDAAKKMNALTMYDAAVHDIHHRAKKDSPSGTALTIANILCDELDRKQYIVSGSPDGAIAHDALQVTSQRIGSVVGTHKVLFDADVDSIELVHTAKNRGGFALGALIAAEWLNGKQGIFTMDDVLAL